MISLSPSSALLLSLKSFASHQFCDGHARHTSPNTPFSAVCVEVGISDTRIQSVFGVESDSQPFSILLVKLKGRLGLLGHILVRLLKVLRHDDVAARATTKNERGETCKNEHTLYISSELSQLCNRRVPIRADRVQTGLGADRRNVGGRHALGPIDIVFEVALFGQVHLGRGHLQNTSPSIRCEKRRRNHQFPPHCLSHLFDKPARPGN